jgi:hypothetical protein
MLSEEQHDLPKKKEIGKSCHLCSHQVVCSAYALFKTGVEPNIFGAEKSTLKAENLAWICNFYLEDESLSK